MGGRLIFTGVVGVVGSQKRGADPVGYFDQIRQDALLGGQAQVVELDKETVLAEYVLITGGGLHRSLHIPPTYRVAVLLSYLGVQQKPGSEAVPVLRWGGGLCFYRSVRISFLPDNIGGQ